MDWSHHMTRNDSVYRWNEVVSNLKCWCPSISSSARSSLSTSSSERSQNTRSWSPSRSLSRMLWLVKWPRATAATTRLCRSALISSTLKSADLNSLMVSAYSSVVHLYLVACLYSFISDAEKAWNNAVSAFGMRPFSRASATGIARGPV